MSFRNTDQNQNQNRGAHGKNKTSIYIGKFKPTTGGNHQKPLTLNQIKQLMHMLVLPQTQNIITVKKHDLHNIP